MPGNFATLWGELRAIPRRQVAQLAFSHAILLAGCLWGGLPYVVLQALVAVELILLDVATIALYPERGFVKHLADLLKLCAALAFVMSFVAISYAVVAHGEKKNPLFVAFDELRDLDVAGIVSLVAYAAGQLSIALWRAWHSTDPRTTWTRDNIGTGAASFLAMFFMVFVAFFVAQPILIGFAKIGIALDANALLATLMVLVRFFLLLVVATFGATKIAAIARAPYETR